MTQKEYARELFTKYYKAFPYYGRVETFGGYCELDAIENAKRAAIMAVNEIIQSLYFFCTNNPYDDYFYNDRIRFFEEVKQEIEEI